MPPDATLQTLTTADIALGLTLAALAVLVILRATEARPASRLAALFPRPAPQPTAAPARELTAVATAGFRTVPLAARPEALLTPALARAVRSHGTGCRLTAQVPLADVIAATAPDTPDRAEALRAIATRRLDFGVFDRLGHLVLAVIVKPCDPHDAPAFLHDAVTREALRQAGVPLLDLPAEATPQDAAARLTALLDASPRLAAGHQIAPFAG